MTVIPLFPEAKGRIVRTKGQITVTGVLKDGTESPIAVMSTLLAGSPLPKDENALANAHVDGVTVEKIVRNPNAPDGTNCIVHLWSLKPGGTLPQRYRLKEHGREVYDLLKKAGMMEPVVTRLSKPRRMIEKWRHKAGLEL